MDEIDTEKGQIPSAKQVTVTSYTPDGLLSGKRGSSPLELFQLLVGINTPASLTSGTGGNSTSTSPLRSRTRKNNVGLYQRAQDEERRMRISYLLTSYISNSLYMLQILLAATFTALSAYKKTAPVVLTVLGAINTVLAGCLAWQKGQGVPQRYRKARDQYQALVLEIEMAERTFVATDSTNSVDGPKADPYAERDRLQKLFDIARADQQANYPDLYVSTGAHAAKDGKDVGQQLEEVKSDAERMRSETMSKIEELVRGLDSKTNAAGKGQDESAVAK